MISVQSERIYSHPNRMVSRLFSFISISLLIEVELSYNGVLVSRIQHSDSYIYVFWMLFPYRLLQVGVPTSGWPWLPWPVARPPVSASIVSRRLLWGSAFSNLSPDRLTGPPV